MRAIAVAVATLGALAFSATSALGAELRWYDDIRYGPQISLSAAAGEGTDLVIRGHQGAGFAPTAVTIENRGGTLTSTTAMPAPGACDAGNGCSVPCRIEAPDRARCVIADGFTTGPAPLNPYESSRGFRGGVFLSLSDARDRITIPADNPVKLSLRSWGSGGPDTWDISRGSAGFEAGEGEVIRSGAGGRVSAGLWGSADVEAANGSADYFYCYYGPEVPQRMRLDVFDETDRNCAGDIQPPPELPPAPAPPDPESAATIASDRVASVRDCIESNLAEPGSCTTP